VIDGVLSVEVNPLGPLQLYVAPFTVVLKLIVPPAHIGELAVGTGVAGSAFTATVPVVFVQPFASVKVKVTFPADTPVTVFPLTVALVGVLLTHVPPVAGVNVNVAPTQTEAGVAPNVGFGLTVTVVVPAAL
jgi:hypothetical protein